MSTLAFFFSILGTSADVIPATSSALADVEVLNAACVSTALAFCGAAPAEKICGSSRTVSALCGFKNHTKNSKKILKTP